MALHRHFAYYPINSIDNFGLHRSYYSRLVSYIMQYTVIGCLFKTDVDGVILSFKHNSRTVLSYSLSTTRKLFVQVVKCLTLVPSRS